MDKRNQGCIQVFRSGSVTQKLGCIIEVLLLDIPSDLVDPLEVPGYSEAEGLLVIREAGRRSFVRKSLHQEVETRRMPRRLRNRRVDSVELKTAQLRYALESPPGPVDVPTVVGHEFAIGRGIDNQRCRRKDSMGVIRDAVKVEDVVVKLFSGDIGRCHGNSGQVPGFLMVS